MTGATAGRSRRSSGSASGSGSAADDAAAAEAQMLAFRKTISELDAVLAVGIAAWLRKRGKVRAWSTRSVARQEPGRKAAHANLRTQTCAHAGARRAPAWTATNAPVPWLAPWLPNCQALRPKLTEEQKEQLLECFDLMDADGSGAIDADEMGAAFKVCTRAQGRAHAMHYAPCVAPRSKAAAANAGLLSRPAHAWAAPSNGALHLQLLGFHLRRDEVEAILSEVDHDGSGEVEYPEVRLAHRTIQQVLCLQHCWWLARMPGA